MPFRAHPGSDPVDDGELPQRDVMAIDARLFLPPRGAAASGLHRRVVGGRRQGPGVSHHATVTSGIVPENAQLRGGRHSSATDGTCGGRCLRRWRALGAQFSPREPQECGTGADLGRLSCSGRSPPIGSMSSGAVLPVSIERRHRAARAGGKQNSTGVSLALNSTQSALSDFCSRTRHPSARVVPFQSGSRPSGPNHSSSSPA
jgi:hypothetical protein